ncbi:DUF6380 family protein [Streptomyces sp. NPDC059696]|uniref:DUF6380 family protein n=1 Tax=Streptomyces sp. NPDC059696 TaxID=3346911 RepID=UPI0036A1F91C
MRQTAACVRRAEGVTGGKRRATLRPGAASLTETAGRAPFERHATAMGEGAR